MIDRRWPYRSDPSPPDVRFHLAGIVCCLVVAFAIMFAVPAKSQEMPVIEPGMWITTSDGKRVCRVTQTIRRGWPVNDGFCSDWQSPHVPMVRGERWRVGDGWVRWNKPWPASGNWLQFHTERGWLP